MARDESVREPLLKRTGAIDSDGKNVRMSLKLMNNPKFRALLVQSVRDSISPDAMRFGVEGAFARRERARTGGVEARFGRTRRWMRDVAMRARRGCASGVTDETFYLRSQLLSLTAFTFMARQTEGLAGPELSTLNDCGDEGCGFTSFYQFKGIVGLYGGFWGFTIVLIMLYLIRKFPPPATELAMYSLFTAVMFIFVIMSIVECTAVVLDPSHHVCKKAEFAQASLAFASAVIALNVFTCVFTWKQWREAKFVGLPKALGKMVKDDDEEQQ